MLRRRYPRRWLAAFRWGADDIDLRIARIVGRRRMTRFEVHTKDLPGYRFVDVHRSVEAHCGARGSFTIIESEHPEESLNGILRGKPSPFTSRRIKGAARAPWSVGPGEDTYLPSDCFWVTGGAEDRLILRVAYHAMQDRVTVDVAAEDRRVAESALDAIVARAADRSIYRNRIVTVSFEAGIKDEFGDVERGDRLSVLFRAEEAVEDDDIVIDEEVRGTLWRNVIDLYRRRDILKAHGVPVRRGVLLYGPPGTGKTFACRYLCGKLPEVTRILVAGTGLLQVKSVFNLARLLQPSLVILEDVDLVFAAREINLYSSVLGELLDQMDGLRPHEEVGVILTTNAIERLEAAIKDRPGRISQCIHLGPPADVLRGRYLRRYLRSYDTSRLELDGLVGMSRGATQAFLKEWVYRAVQIATERLDEAADPLELRNYDFEAALREMRLFSTGSTGRIIGFHEPRAAT
jgi:hypothetical protein